MKLPPEKDDPMWARVRAHDVEELWDHSRAPHVAAAYRARLGLLTDVVATLAGPSGRVLDVGCAQGTLGLMLGERGLRVDLLDIRPENIAYARARYEHGPVEFHVGVLGETCPPVRDYDVVVCTEVIEHVAVPSQFLAQLKAKVRPGGSLCMTTPNGDYLFSRLPTYGSASQRTIDEAEPNSLDGDAHRYLYTREELIALIRGVGLRVEQHGFFSPAWLEGHIKTRYLHRLYYSWRQHLLPVPATIPEALGRRLCSSQFIVGQLPAAG
jgi:2-polyprenyl-3-methyl-5-hydroxy-6-metoxy-1,4-benzoquinol methylase